MTFLVVAALLALFLSTVVAPWVDERRKARRVLDRVGRITYPPRFDGGPRRVHDPSPRPRKRSAA